MIFVINSYSYIDFCTRRHKKLYKNMSPAKLGKGTRNSAQTVPKKARQALLIST